MLEEKVCVSFDDVLIEPGEYCTISSRSDVDTSVTVAGLKLGTPLISSPMDTVTESRMAISIGKLGGLGIMHRFMSHDERLRMISRVADEENVLCAFAIGVSEQEKDFLDFVDTTIGLDEVNAVCIDVANGWSVGVKDMVEHIKSRYPDLKIIAGNVANAAGYRGLADWGVDAVRVGIGGGSICMTRIQTGIGVPTLTSVLECNRERQTRLLGGLNAPEIIADGGVKYPQDLCKSLVAGASAVICGGIFAGTQEAPGEIIKVTDKDLRKKYRGMASEEVQEERRGGLKEGTVAEGVATLIPYEGSLKRVVSEFTGGLKSSMTYVNSRTTESYIARPDRLLRITESSVRESHAYGTRKR